MELFRCLNQTTGKPSTTIVVTTQLMPRSAEKNNAETMAAVESAEFVQAEQPASTDFVNLHAYPIVMAQSVETMAAEEAVEPVRAVKIVALAAVKFLPALTIANATTVTAVQQIPAITQEVVQQVALMLKLQTAKMVMVAVQVVVILVTIMTVLQHL